MLRWSHIAALLVLSGATLADNVTFLRLDKSIVQQRIEQPPATPEQRVSALLSMFEKAGCPKRNIEVQPIPDQAMPNVVCTLPGTDYGTILISARLDYDTRGDEGQCGWSGVAMLPLLAESLNSTNHRHTLVFAAFSGANREGVNWYWKSLSEEQRREFRGTIDLDHVGRTAAGFNANTNGAVMSRILPAAARALQYAAEPQSIADVPEGNAAFFQKAHVPSITIYSAGYESSGGSNQPTPKVQTVLPGTGHENTSPGPRSVVLKTGVDPAIYNQTYNLLCVYVLFLDRGLGASKRPAAETQVAKAEPPPKPAEPTPATQGTQTISAAPVATLTTAPAELASAKPPETQPMLPVSNLPQPTATIRVNTRLVQFDVVVTDAQGRPVKDLKASDFAVMQDGKPQTVSAFELHTPSVVPAKQEVSAGSPKPTSAVLPSNTYSNAPAKAPQSSWTVILFDILNTAVTDQAYARSQLLQLLKSVPQGQPTALFVLTRNLEMVQGFTQDPEELIRRAELLNPAKSSDLTTVAEREREVGRVVTTAQLAAPGGSAPAQAGSVDMGQIASNQAARILQNYNDHEAFRNTDRALFTLAAMRGIARAVSGYPGRKNLVWLSGSFPINIEPDPASSDPFRNVRGFEAEIRDTSSLLATSRVAAYPVDVRGLQSKGIDIATSQAESQFMTDVAPNGSTRVNAPSTNTLNNTLIEQTTAFANDRLTMKNIAQETGGEAFVSTNDLKRVMARSLEDGSTYYTLAYTPPKEDEAGGYHRVTVQVPNKSWKLAYRRGYYSIPQTAVSSAVGTAALQAALQPGMPPSTSMLLTAALELPDATRKDVKINYIIDSNSVQFADAPENKKRAQVDCMVIAFDSAGKEIAHASDTLDATVPLNAYAAIQKYGLPAHQLISLPPGRYNLRIGVMDRTTQQIGTVDAPLVVPETAVAQR
jgi:VWFA-related protein